MRRSMITATVVSSLCLFFAMSAFAEAGSPWWHLVSTSQPSYIQPGTAKQQVWQLTVSATGGTYELEETPYGIVGLEAGESPANVQATLEGSLRIHFYFPPGPIMEVTARSGPYNQYEMYEIKLLGELTYTHNFELSTTGILAIQSQTTLTGGLETAVVKEVSRGRPDGVVVVTATNLGDAAVNPETQPVTVTDRLPAGLEAVGIEGIADENFLHSAGEASPLECSLKELSCTFTGKKVGNTFPAFFVEPYEQLRVKVLVKATGARTGAVNEASVIGGGAPAAGVRQALTVSDAPVPFGASTYELRPEEAGGGVDTQAGSHPFQLTTTLGVNTENAEGKPTALTKDLYFYLPSGLIGNPHPFAQCTLASFLKEACPLNTVIGVSRSTIRLNLAVLNGSGYRGETTIIVPVYNLEPSIGEPARFGFIIEGEPVLLTTSVRTGGDYGVTVTVRNVTQAIEFQGDELTIWGVPGDPRHNISRGEECLGVATAQAEGNNPGECPPFVEPRPPSLLGLPTSCSGPLRTTMQSDSWTEPQNLNEPLVSTQPMPAMDGCNRLPFSSSITVAPDGQQASTPTGLTVGIHIPQEETLDAEGLSEAAVKDATVALPEGVQISSAGAGGLLACSEEQVGFTGVEAPGGTNPGGTNLYTPGPAGCPDASKVATAEIKTPLLPEPLVGAAYLAAQNANPFGSLIALYLYAEDPVAGVRVKLAGEVKLNETTGQIVTVFPNSPQVPFEEAKLHFFGGERAPLSTPPLCGSYTSTASITPWSGNEPSKSTSTFEITSGPNGAPCASPRPFQPGFNAGTTSVQAGGYSPLTMTLSRPDADQALGKLSVVFPPGISAGLRGVRLCEEPQAATGQCPAESQIGTVTVSTGFGGDPFPVETGKAYITGPYEGDPFGVDVVVPAVAGPFNLGTEVVRSKVDVDPTDAHLTVVSDAFPTMLDGIPLQLQHINVLVNRPDFVFNPTSCEPMKLTGVLGSSEGASANVANPFQVTNCAALSFKPEFAVSTSAKTSRTEGASLHVSLTLPNTPRGTGANVAKVRVSLPKQLPSPLKTLQRACTEKVFAENPSSCPKASRVGEAKVETPVLEGPLTGPAYFVSHGGAKYPELIIVLTGEDGVTVQVHGETFISKAGITTATFGTVPDVPFSNFELELPQREYPALTANGNLCKGTLIMPTEFLGQNGLKINQETKISVAGCPKSKKVSHKRSKKHKAAKRGKGKKTRKG